jgi:hypothetical protein
MILRSYHLCEQVSCVHWQPYCLNMNDNGQNHGVSSKYLVSDLDVEGRLVDVSLFRSYLSFALA